MSVRRRVGVLVSGNGSNLQALIDAARGPDYPAEIALVVSNEPEALALERAREAGIAAALISHQDFSERADFEAALDTELRRAGCEIVCLAGFMRILGAAFVEGWAGRMLNIHPSLLPAFPGRDTHRRVLESGAKITGCTVHLVTPDLDAGPIIAQAAVPVMADDNPATLAARVQGEEHRLYPQALRLLAEGRVEVDPGAGASADTAKIADQPEPSGVRLHNPGRQS